MFTHTVQLASLAVALCAATTAWAKPRVEMELIAEPGLRTAAAAQRWTKLLGELGVARVRVAGGNPAEVGEQTQGSGQSALVRVTVKLDDRGMLVTSGGRFALSDRARLEQWLSGLGNPAEAPPATTVFGLTAEQYAAAKRTLGSRLRDATRGATAKDAVEKIGRGLSIPLQIDPAIDRALAADDPVRDELQGLSAGTALAAIARPAGAVLVPRASGGALELALVKPAEQMQSWPIGWPPAEKDEKQVLPKLYEFLNVSLDGIPAAEAIEAVKGRLEVPILYDHNNLVRHQIDLAKPVHIPAGKSYYRKILQQVLFQAGLKFELRVDDAGKPFLWITTLKP